MTKRMTADDIVPLIADLTPLERVKLIRLIVEGANSDEAAIYQAMPPQPDEFSRDAESLDWEAEGWEEFN